MNGNGNVMMEKHLQPVLISSVRISSERPDEAVSRLGTNRSISISHRTTHMQAILEQCEEKNTTSETVISSAASNLENRNVVFELNSFAYSTLYEN